MAAELARRPVTVIVAAGGNVAAVAARAATSTIPIVFRAVADPVKSGLVASLNRPGGNVTGIAALTTELDGKRLELLNELAPSAGAIGALVNPSRPDADTQLRGVQAAARMVGRRLVVLSPRTERELETAFAASSSSASVRSSSARTPSSSAGASRSWRSPRGPPFPPSTSGASSPSPAA